MARRWFFGFVALLFSFGLVVADEIKGTVKKVDAEKSAITVTIDGKERTLDVAKDVKLKFGKKVQELKDIQEGREVILTTSKKDDKEIVTEISKAPKK